mmetsp:Transcript_10958/g.22112  ORF Transcript_10958/g.22112 Transcript_10958/m.22112 type:complete len:291 (+) Transcript_10958:1414-2286(+)
MRWIHDHQSITLQRLRYQATNPNAVPQQPIPQPISQQQQQQRQFRQQRQRQPKRTTRIPRERTRQRAGPDANEHGLPATNPQTHQRIPEKNQEIIFRGRQVVGGGNHPPVHRLGHCHWNRLRDRLLPVLLGSLFRSGVPVENAARNVRDPVHLVVGRLLLGVDPAGVHFHVHAGGSDGGAHGRAGRSALHHIPGPLRGLHPHGPRHADGLCLHVLHTGRRIAGTGGPAGGHLRRARRLCVQAHLSADVHQRGAEAHLYGDGRGPGGLFRDPAGRVPVCAGGLFPVRRRVL